ncbi:MAG: phage tail protein, partial [Kiritimatiellia bacterium]
MEFSAFTITNKGQALIAKLMLGSGMCDFTAIKLSSTVYADAQLAGLTSLTNIKQTAPITSKAIQNLTTIKVEGAVDNRTLATGYNINTIGLYATDPDDGEILYAVSRALTAGYMPPYNGVAVSGCYFKFLVTVGNASQVTLMVDPAGYASIGDINNLTAEIADIKGYVGYNDANVYGVEVDYTNKTFTRLAGAVGKTPGESFDGIKCFGGRRRCIMTDAGVVLAYKGDTGYTETGALIVAITLGEGESATTYAIGTK